MSDSDTDSASSPAPPLPTPAAPVPLVPPAPVAALGPATVPVGTPAAEVGLSFVLSQGSSAPASQAAQAEFATALGAMLSGVSMGNLFGTNTASGWA